MFWFHGPHNQYTTSDDNHVADDDHHHLDAPNFDNHNCCHRSVGWYL
jgi:hypothetical protein